MSLPLLQLFDVIDLIDSEGERDLSFSNGFSTPVQKPAQNTVQKPSKKTNTVSNTTLFTLVGLVVGIILLGFAMFTFGPALYSRMTAPTPKFTLKHVQLVRETKIGLLMQRYRISKLIPAAMKGRSHQLALEVRPLVEEELATLKESCKKLLDQLPPIYAIRASLKTGNTKVTLGSKVSPIHAAARSALMCHAVK